MDTELIFRLAMAILGLLLLPTSFYALAKKKMTESMGLCWVFASIFLLIFGIVPGLCAWSMWLSNLELAVLVLFAAGAITFLFIISSMMSILFMKNQELAMQVSLLNQENERILGELEKITGKSKVNI